MYSVGLEEGNIVNILSSDELLLVPSIGPKRKGNMESGDGRGMGCP